MYRDTNFKIFTDQNTKSLVGDREGERAFAVAKLQSLLKEVFIQLSCRNVEKTTSLKSERLSRSRIKFLDSGISCRLACIAIQVLKSPPAKTRICVTNQLIIIGRLNSETVDHLNQPIILTKEPNFSLADYSKRIARSFVLQSTMINRHCILTLSLSPQQSLQLQLPSSYTL